MILRELMSYRVGHYRNFHFQAGTDQPGDGWDEPEPYPVERLYTNEQERTEMNYAFSLITTPFRSTGCKCYRLFYWYYECFLLDECQCQYNCCKILHCRYIRD